MHSFVTTAIAIAFCIAAVNPLRAGQLEPAAAPAPTMYTLGELYQKLTNALNETQAANLMLTYLAIELGDVNQTLSNTLAEVQANQERLMNLEARLNADGKQVTSGDMVFIPAGSFVMGATTNMGHTEGDPDERPQHTVNVSAFYMDKYEVTSNLWREVFTWATNKSYSFGTNWSGKASNHPIHSVDWYDAIAWCNARSQRDGFTPCYTNADGSFYTNSTVNSFTGGCNWAASGYRLPTEAEWEKAARGGKPNTRFPWDDANTIQHARANYSATNAYYESSPTQGFHPGTAVPDPRTLAVGSFAPNGYGLYDMAGNVREWVWDYYKIDYYGISPDTDPRGPGTGTLSVQRGGSWANNALICRVAYRYTPYATTAVNAAGFRCVRGL